MRANQNPTKMTSRLLTSSSSPAPSYSSAVPWSSQMLFSPTSRSVVVRLNLHLRWRIVGILTLRLSTRVQIPAPPQNSSSNWKRSQRNFSSWLQKLETLLCRWQVRQTSDIHIYLSTADKEKFLEKLFVELTARFCILLFYCISFTFDGFIHSEFFWLGQILLSCPSVVRPVQTCCLPTLRICALHGWDSSSHPSSTASVHLHHQYLILSR